MITLTVTYVIRAGEEAKAETYLRAMIDASRQEPGCRTYHVNRSSTDLQTIVFYERYDDEAALDAHRETPHFIANIKNGLQTIAERRTAQLFVPFE